MTPAMKNLRQNAEVKQREEHRLKGINPENIYQKPARNKSTIAFCVHDAAC